MRSVFAYVTFSGLNYIRRHRYLRELVAVIIFQIFFRGFLYDSQPGAAIWLVFSVFAMVLNVITTPSVFFQERGNTLYFLIGKPAGRKYFFLSRLILIVIIDLFWLGIFILLYGLRYLSLEYFLRLPLHLFPVLLILLLSTLLISLAYTYRPQLSWLLFLLVVFGGIVNKPAVFPLQGILEGYKLLVLLLPPFQELSFLSVSLDFWTLRGGFLPVALVQMVILYWWSYRGVLRRDFL